MLMIRNQFEQGPGGGVHLFGGRAAPEGEPERPRRVERVDPLRRENPRRSAAGTGASAGDGDARFPEQVDQFRAVLDRKSVV